MINTIIDIDLSILSFIAANLKCAFLDFFMPIITKLGDHGIIPIILAVVLIIIPKTRKTGIAMGIAIALGGLFGNLILKNVIARTRPYDIVEGIELLVPALSDFSFPSGHTLVVFEVATVLLKREKRAIGIVAMVLAVIVAFSRLYLYVHYPTDVIVGVILGIAFGLVGCFAVNKIEKSFKK